LVRLFGEVEPHHTSKLIVFDNKDHVATKDEEKKTNKSQIMQIGRLFYVRKRQIDDQTRSQDCRKSKDKIHPGTLDSCNFHLLPFFQVLL